MSKRRPTSKGSKRKPLSAAGPTGDEPAMPIMPASDPLKAESRLGRTPNRSRAAELYRRIVQAQDEEEEAERKRERGKHNEAA